MTFSSPIAWEIEVEITAEGPGELYTNTTVMLSNISD
jgi:hypothetical protein